MTNSGGGSGGGAGGNAGSGGAQSSNSTDSGGGSSGGSQSGGSSGDASSGKSKDTGTAKGSASQPTTTKAASASPLGELQSADDGSPPEAPSAADKVTSALADSLDGGLPRIAVPKARINLIPGMLRQPIVPRDKPVDGRFLPSWGNAALWQ
ncbi:MAG TPA: hypothetical protein VIK18_09140 [Pirellulales bacterium]